MTEKRSAAVRMSRAVLWGLTAGVVLTACGGGEEAQSPRVTAAQQCDQTLSPGAAKALEALLGTEKFDAAPVGALDRAVGQLTEDYAQGKRRSTHPPMCRPSPADASVQLDIAFGLYDEDDLFGDAPPVGLHPYDMGREAQSGSDRAYVFVECVSPRLKGSERRPARIRGTLRFPKSGLPDTVATREANLTVLHSVTLALVKRLGCAGNAGLAETPVLKAE
ncbi:hypothetical protein ACFW6S_10930 [Streptomyces sp. NPDC058740]|uniref:hypothetical protein n=1 Tax=Streptomyces sp. NPDC058740 TaxID=3346619 RepID=UPI00368E6F38